ncbi:MAG: sigma-70 family RNA polymerase sigma factor [Polyangiaceae bacterium]|nr:sigma-70 family RNA polymerase sigma factor [Polyangiaceae bacterium]
MSSPRAPRLVPLPVPQRPGGRVEPIAQAMDDAALVAAVARGDRSAAGELFDRYALVVRRVLARILGVDAELGDAVHDVFVEALRSAAGIREPERLEFWLVGIAVHRARSIIRRRTRARWLIFRAPEELPDIPSGAPDPAVDEQVRATYVVLRSMPADLRIAFALRFVDGMKLEEVAGACGVSLATIKRRLREAERVFRERARAHPALAELDPAGGGAA